jgi:hypothetical protein
MLALREGDGTYEELAVRTGMRGVAVSTRLSELRRHSFIEDCGTRKTSSGSPATVVALTPAGRAWLDADREVVAA